MSFYIVAVIALSNRKETTWKLHKHKQLMKKNMGITSPLLLLVDPVKEKGKTSQEREKVENNIIVQRKNKNKNVQVICRLSGRFR